MGRVERLDEDPVGTGGSEEPDPLPALQAEVGELFRRYRRLLRRLAGAAPEATPGKSGESPVEGGADSESGLPADPLHLSYWVASRLHIHLAEKQALLECNGALQRLARERELLRRENQALRLLVDRLRGPEKGEGPSPLLN